MPSSLDQVKKNKKGLLLIDKPEGWTSFDVVAKLRRILGVKKIGHAGTLDPLATGLLIVLVSKEWTQLQDQFLKLDKEYLCEAQLGIETDSYDITGKLVNQLIGKSVKVSQQQLVTVLDKFRGEIKQTVPAFSAVKVKGQKLYRASHRGKINTALLPEKLVHIKELELLSFKNSKFKIKTLVSSGTYIRSLVHDVGQELGVGAVVLSLRRTKIGELSLSSPHLSGIFTNVKHSRCPLH